MEKKKELMRKLLCFIHQVPNYFVLYGLHQPMTLALSYYILWFAANRSTKHKTVNQFYLTSSGLYVSFQIEFFILFAKASVVLINHKNSISLVENPDFSSSMFYCPVWAACLFFALGLCRAGESLEAGTCTSALLGSSWLFHARPACAALLIEPSEMAAIMSPPDEGPAGQDNAGIHLQHSHQDYQQSGSTVSMLLFTSAKSSDTGCTQRIKHLCCGRTPGEGFDWLYQHTIQFRDVTNQVLVNCCNIKCNMIGRMSCFNKPCNLHTNNWNLHKKTHIVYGLFKSSPNIFNV